MLRITWHIIKLILGIRNVIDDCPCQVAIVMFKVCYEERNGNGEESAIDKT